MGKFIPMRFELANANHFSQINKWMPELGNYYDGHESSKFFEQISNKEKLDPFGFFTLKKEIWTASNEDVLLGFICLNYKRGGSIKIGPIIVNPDSRGVGIGKFLLSHSIEVAESKKVRKIYATTSSLNKPASLLFKNSGFVQEAILPNQYRDGTEEYVWGLFTAEHSKGHRSTRSMLLDKSDPCQPKVRSYENDIDRKYLDSVIDVMKEWHGDIDEQFAEGIVSANNKELDYEIKGKKVFTSTCGDKQTGITVTTPKRGGSVKVYPIYGSTESQKSLISNISDFYRQMGFRKIYTFIPSGDDNHLKTLKENGFEYRGILRSPYKDGYDLTILDLNL